MSQKPILYGRGPSSCSWRVRAALEMKNIDYEFIIVSYASENEEMQKKFLEVNPLQQVPALVVDGNTLTQSVAIIEYLDETRNGTPLYPKDPFKRAQTRQIVELINSGIQPLQNTAVVERCSVDKENQKAWQVYWIGKGLTALEQVLEKTSGKYCIGDEVTAADCVLAPQIFAARRFGVATDKFPLATYIYSNLLKVEAFRKSHPFNPADAPEDRRGLRLHGKVRVRLEPSRGSRMCVELRKLTTASHHVIFILTWAGSCFEERTVLETAMEFRNYNMTAPANDSFNLSCSANGTTSPAPSWGIDVILIVVCTALIFIFNLCVASVIMTAPKLHTPFGTYVASLLLFDALLSLHGWLEIYPSNFDNQLTALCNFRAYVSWVITGIPLNLHVLIGFSRVWTVAFPISYRNYHTSKLAGVLVIFVIAYVHIACLPGVILNALYYQLPSFVADCELNVDGLWIWSRLVMLLIYQLPVGFMIASWIYIAVKHRRQSRSMPRSADINTIVGRTTTNVTTVRRTRSSTGFRVLSALTISVVLCWAPYETYDTLRVFIPNMTEPPTSVYHLLLALYLFQTILDPVLMVVTLPDLRDAVKGIFSSCTVKALCR